MTPEFLVAGHVVQDLTGDEGWRIGGAVAYASLLARNLGLRAAALTACSDDLDLESLLPGIEVRRVPSNQTTQMRNVYPRDGAGPREQWMPQRAEPLTGRHLPGDWRSTPIVLLGPVAGEIDDSLVRAFSPDSLIGAGVQGWLREVAPDTRVRPVNPARWNAAAVLAQADALFLSDEDLPSRGPEERPSVLADWCRLVDFIAFTRGYEGADVCHRGEWRRIGAFPAASSELTGAGDTFAAGFLVRFAETGDPWEATRFASAAASIAIERDGVGGVPASRAAIDERLRGNAEVVATPL